MEPRYNEPLYNEVLDITEIEPRHNGRDPFDQNFGPKLSGSVRSNLKSFEKTGPPFDMLTAFPVGVVRQNLSKANKFCQSLVPCLVGKRSP